MLHAKEARLNSGCVVACNFSLPTTKGKLFCVKLSLEDATAYEERVMKKYQVNENRMQHKIRKLQKEWRK